MKVKELIKKLEKLDQEKQIFIQSAYLCNDIEVKVLDEENFHPPVNEGVDESNIGDYFLVETEEWLNEKGLI